LRHQKHLQLLHILGLIFVIINYILGEKERVFLFCNFEALSTFVKIILVVGREEYSDLSYLGVLFSRFNLYIRGKAHTIATIFSVVKVDDFRDIVGYLLEKKTWKSCSITLYKNTFIFK